MQLLNNLLNQFGKQKTIPKNYFYISEGQIFKRFFFIKKGILRSFCVTENGDEKTILFAKEGMAYGVVDSIFFDKGSSRYWQALEEVELIEIEVAQFKAMAENNIEYLNLRSRVLESLLIDAVQRLESFVRDSPEKRYLDLIEEKSDLINRIPDKYIASYIGVTPVTLSRIRKRIANSKNL